jgi:hypothetical protein
MFFEKCKNKEKGEGRRLLNGDSVLTHFETP